LERRKGSVFKTALMKNANIYIRIVSIVSLNLILFGSLEYCTQERPGERRRSEDRIVGVKIYEYEGSLPVLFSEWRKLGINTVFVSESLASRDEFRLLAKTMDIAFFIIFPVFYDPESLEKAPDLYAITEWGEKAKEEWVTFVCPSREDFRKKKIELAKDLVKKLDPDGLSIDFIRHFVFWEKVYPGRSLQSLVNTCFDASCVRKFQQDAKIAIPDSADTAQDVYAWIRQNCLSEWTQWKCGLITSMIDEIAREVREINPRILINVHAVPWRQKDFGGAIKIVAGQDFTRIAPIVDFLSPMTYAHMVKREPAWIHSVVNDIQSQAECPILPSIQVKEAYLEDRLTVREFRSSLAEALKPPSQGVIFWSWEALNAEPEKKDVIAELIHLR
jgi:hypothetical protein